MGWQQLSRGTKDCFVRVSATTVTTIKRGQMAINSNGQFIKIDDHIFNRDEIRSVKKLKKAYKSTRSGQEFHYVVQVQYGALGYGPKAPSSVWLTLKDGNALESILMNKETNVGSNTSSK